MSESIGSRYNPDGTSDHGVTGDRHLIHIDQRGLTFDPDIQITFTATTFTLSAPWGQVTIMGGPTSQILNHDRGLRIDQESLIRHAQRTGQRSYSWNEMALAFAA